MAVSSVILNDYAWIADNPAHDITGAYMTFACWYQPTTVDGNSRGLMGKWDSAASSGSAYICYANAGTLVWAIRGGATDICTSPTFLQAGMWYHVVGVKDGLTATSLRLYVNGKLNTVASSTSSIQNSAEFFYLFIYQSATVSLAGKLADYAMWDAALGSDEILALSRGMRAKYIRPNNLRAYYPLDVAKAPSQFFKDESKYAVHIMAEASSTLKNFSDPPELNHFVTQPEDSIARKIKLPGAISRGSIIQRYAAPLNHQGSRLMPGGTGNPSVVLSRFWSIANNQFQLAII